MILMLKMIFQDVEAFLAEYPELDLDAGEMHTEEEAAEASDGFVETEKAGN